jgi:hypothetical protein
MDSAVRLTQAIHDNTCRLYCDGVVVKPHIAVTLKVKPQLDNDGRWTADIMSTAPIGWAKPSYQWEFDVDEIVALLPVRRGIKGANWEIHATLEMERLGRKVALDKHNSRQLLKHLKRTLRLQIGFVPKDSDALAAVIRGFLRGEN